MQLDRGTAVYRSQPEARGRVEKTLQQPSMSEEAADFAMAVSDAIQAGSNLPPHRLLDLSLDTRFSSLPAGRALMAKLETTLQLMQHDDARLAAAAVIVLMQYVSPGLPDEVQDVLYHNTAGAMRRSDVKASVAAQHAATLTAFRIWRDRRRRTHEATAAGGGTTAGSKHGVPTSRSAQPAGSRRAPAAAAAAAAVGSKSSEPAAPSIQPAEPERPPATRPAAAVGNSMAANSKHAQLMKNAAQPAPPEEVPGVRMSAAAGAAAEAPGTASAAVSARPATPGHGQTLAASSAAAAAAAAPAEASHTEPSSIGHTPVLEVCGSSTSSDDMDDDQIRRFAEDFADEVDSQPDCHAVQILAEMLDHHGVRRLSGGENVDAYLRFCIELTQHSNDTLAAAALLRMMWLADIEMHATPPGTALDLDVAERLATCVVVWHMLATQRPGLMAAVQAEVLEIPHLVHVLTEACRLSAASSGQPVQPSAQPCLAKLLDVVEATDARLATEATAATEAEAAAESSQPAAAAPAAEAAAADAEQGPAAAMFAALQQQAGPLAARAAQLQAAAFADRDDRQRAALVRRAAELLGDIGGVTAAMPPPQPADFEASKLAALLRSMSLGARMDVLQAEGQHGALLTRLADAARLTFATLQQLQGRRPAALPQASACRVLRCSSALLRQADADRASADAAMRVATSALAAQGLLLEAPQQRLLAAAAAAAPAAACAFIVEAAAVAKPALNALVRCQGDTRAVIMTLQDLLPRLRPPLETMAAVCRGLHISQWDGVALDALQDTASSLVASIASWQSAALVLLLADEKAPLGSRDVLGPSPKREVSCQDLAAHIVDLVASMLSEAALQQIGAALALWDPAAVHAALQRLTEQRMFRLLFRLVALPPETMRPPLGQRSIPATAAAADGGCSRGPSSASVAAALAAAAGAVEALLTTGVTVSSTLIDTAVRAAVALLHLTTQHVADTKTLSEAGVRLAATSCSVLAELAAAHAALLDGKRKQEAAAAALQRHVQAAFAKRKVQQQLVTFVRWLSEQQPAAAMQLRGALKDTLMALAAVFAYSIPDGSPGHGKQEFAVDFQGLRDFDTALKAVRRRLSAKADADLASAYAALQEAAGRDSHPAVAARRGDDRQATAAADRMMRQLLSQESSRTPKVKTGGKSGAKK